MKSVRERRVALLLFAFWLVLACFVTSRHEPWRDEADAWLYARDAPLRTFFNGGRYGGTPLLWYVVQAPFARLGLHYDVQRWLHLAIAASAMWLMLLRAPLPLWARAAFAFSFFGLFEYAVVARSYSLTLLFLWWACLQWTNRRRRPWFCVAVSLLAQTNLPGMIMAGSLLAVAVLSKPSTPEASRAWWRWFVVAAVAYLLAVAQVWPPDDGQKSLTLNVFAAVSAVEHGLFPWASGPAQGVLGGAALGFLVASVWHQRNAFAFYIVTLLGFTILFQFVHGGALRHFGFLFVAYVAAIWLARAEERDGVDDAALAVDATTTSPSPSRARSMAFAMTVVAAPWVVECKTAVVSELEAPFSNAQGLGEWIVDHDLKDRRFVLAAYAVAVAPWISGPVYYPASDQTTTYLPWNNKQFSNRGMGSGDVVTAARAYRKQHPDALVIVGSRLPQPEQMGLRLLRAENHHRWQGNGEDLWLYGPLTAPVLPSTGSAEPAEDAPEAP